LEQTDRQTDTRRQTDRHIDRQTDRQTETDKDRSFGIDSLVIAGHELPHTMSM